MLNAPVSMGQRYANLPALLRDRVHAHPERVVFTFVGEGRESWLTYGCLLRRAWDFADALRRAGALPGERALLLYPEGQEFVVAFLGCLEAGVAAIPAYPPRRGRSHLALKAIARNGRPGFVLTTKRIEATRADLTSEIPSLASAIWLALDMRKRKATRREDAPMGRIPKLAFIQYTSGSTSEPKGVMVTHINLLHNQEIIQRAFGQNAGSVIVGWLPLYHDMGLIGNVLQTLYAGARGVLMSPLAFLTRPARWLETISRHRATTSGGPNFAFERCVQIQNPTSPGFDLSCWRVAFCGAEPVRAQTLDRFSSRYKTYGFQDRAWFPCYGLAEATLFVTGPGVGKGSLVHSFEKEALGRDCAKVTADPKRAQVLVSCGRAWQGHRVLVVDPHENRSLPGGRVGEIWVSGPSVAAGYWDLPEETAATFGARVADEKKRVFLRTGDLGFIWRGALFLTGRLKDLLIIRGRNYYPQDIEATAERSHAQLRPGCGAAFGVEADGLERLIVAQEVTRQSVRQLKAEAVMEAIRQQIAADHGIQAHTVVLLRPGAIPKTSSGKVRRKACREMFLRGELPVLASDQAAAQARSPVLPARESLVAVPPRRQRAFLRDYLKQLIGETLGVRPSRVDEKKPLNTLGLDSALALDLQFRLEKEWQLVLPEAAFLGERSVEDLAVFLQKDILVPGSESDGVTIVPTSAEQPLTPNQEALWYLYRMDPANTAYYLSFALNVSGELNLGKWEQALSELTRRQSVLSMVVNLKNGKPHQQFPGEISPFFDFEDATGWSEKKLDKGLAAHAARTLDLEKGPCFSVKLFKRSAREHVLSWKIHHIAADFWSILILMDELMGLYQGRSFERPAPFGEYVNRQLEWLASPECERALVFWKNRLAGDAFQLDLPTDLPRLSRPSFRGARIPLSTGARLAAAVKRLSRERGVTPPALLLAAFQVLLSRYSGQEDVLVGSPSPGRISRRWARTVGYFANPILLRANLGGNPGFSSFVKASSRELRVALSHQSLPFQRLVTLFAAEGNPARSPLFQAMFNFLRPTRLAESAPFALGLAGARMNFGPWTLTARPLAHRTAPFECSLILTETADGFVGAWEYQTDLFLEASAEGMVRHYLNLLEAIVDGCGTPVYDLPMLGRSERKALLRSWCGARPDRPPMTLHAWVKQSAGAGPDRVALAFEARFFSLDALVARSTVIARRLREMGVAAEHPVGLYLERGPELIVGLLAILIAGGAYVPLDPAFPADRLAYMLEDAGVRVVVTETALSGRLSGSDDRSLFLDGDIRGVAGEKLPPVDPAQLAYLIYTSGSTGRPKGVAVTHRSLVNFLRSTARAPGLGPGDNFLAVTTISFDIAALECFLPLVTGAKLVMAGRRMATDGRILARVMDAWVITAMQATPATWRLLREAGASPKPQLKIFCGGEALPGDLASFLRGFGREAWNLYGPTETTIWSAARRLTAAEEEATETIEPIGGPLDQTELYVVDQRLHPQPGGVTGELCIGGFGVARGYHYQVGLTAENMVPDPFSGRVGNRLYRTGDLVRATDPSAGTLTFLGRMDHQIKLRGFRIETGEIEIALAAHPSVKEAAVVLAAPGPGREQLAAFLVMRDGGSANLRQEGAPNGESVRVFLRSRLPDYMIPGAFYQLLALPLTPNRKIDRKALRKRAAQTSSASPAGREPRTQVEKTVTGIWEEVLGREGIGRDAHFFEVGGHSLLAMRVLSRLEEAFNLKLPASLLFEAPTVTVLSEKVAEAKAILQTSSQVDTQADSQADEPTDFVRIKPLTLRRLSETGEPHLSFAQERLWLLDRLEQGFPIYNVPFALNIMGPLDVSALSRAIKTAVARHESLRSTFPERNGKPMVVLRAAATLVPVVDLGGLGSASRRQTVKNLGVQEVRHVFSLAEGPLFRASLLMTGPRSRVLLLNMHHIITDAWSIAVLLRELGTWYRCNLCGRKTSGLPVISIQYTDFAQAQRQWLKGVFLQRLLTFWRDHLDGAPEHTALPYDRRRSGQPNPRGQRLRFSLDNPLTQSLTVLGRKSGASLFMVLQAGFLALLHRYGGQNEVVLGNMVANRNHRELEPLIGFFVNTLAMRHNLAGDPPFTEFLARTRRVVLDGLAHGDLPFDQLVEVLKPRRDAGHGTLFQAAMVYENDLIGDLSLTGLQAVPLPLELQFMKFDLTLVIRESVGGLEVFWDYLSDVFDRSTILRINRQYHQVLRSIAAQPQQPISVLPILGEGERQQLLVDWREHESTNRGEGLLRAIRAQAEQAPDEVGVVQEDCYLTRATLAGRAGGWAQRLRNNGAGPGAVVAIITDRCPEWVTAMVAILEAGAVFLSIAAETPPERLAFLLADSRARIVFAHGPDQRFLRGFDFICLDEACVPSMGLPSPVPIGGVPAYLVYTSGSTGRPKGALVSRTSMANLIWWYHDYFGLGPGVKVFLPMAVAFDASIKCVFGPLAAGGETVLFGTGPFDPQALYRTIAQHRVHIFNGVPSMTYPLMEWAEPESYLGLASLTHLVLGGEPTEPDKLRAWFASPHCRCSLVNIYGPTESADSATVLSLSSAEMARTARVPMGRPITNNRFYILDFNLNPVPIGAPGDLALAGAGLALGYVHRPGLTAERFVPNPWEPCGARLYKTGDRVKWLANGRVEFLGRLDHQVKLRGLRIEPGEIEALLRVQPGVREAAVIMGEDPSGRKSLVACMVLEAPARQRPLSSWRSFMLGKLPAYMVPAYFVEMDGFPKLPNGKVDRAALGRAALGRAALGRAALGRDALGRAALGKVVPGHTRLGPPGGEIEDFAPRNQMETVLAKLWSDLLGIAQVGIHDNFFELGGDSILSIQLVSRAKGLGLALTPKQVFEHQTITGLAEVATLVAVSDRGLVSGTFPLTPIQRRFFTLQTREPHHFNQALLLKVEKAVRHDWLARVVGEWSRHHDALRLRFRRESGSWRPFHGEVNRAVTFQVKQLDRPWREALNTAAAEVQAGLDLGNGPLLRAVLFTGLEDAHDRLLLVAHHLVVDGVSWRILLEDLVSGYEQLAKGANALRLPAKTTSFKEWAIRLEALAQSGKLDLERDFWKEQVAENVLSADFSVSEEAYLQGQTQQIQVSLDASHTAALLQQVHKAYNTRINDLLVAALAMTLVDWTGATSFGLAMESHGREALFSEVDLSRTVGWFTAVYPLRLTWTGQQDPGAGIRDLKEQLRRVPHNGIGYGLLQDIEDSRPGSQPGILFNYLGRADRVLPRASFIKGARPYTDHSLSPRSHRDHLLEINGMVGGQRLHLTWIFATKAFRTATVEKLAQALVDNLKAIIAHCRGVETTRPTPSDFPLAAIDGANLDRLVTEFGPIEDFYALAPLQAGMLFQTLLAPDSDAYFQQLTCCLGGAIQTDAFKRAWQWLLARHDVLRASFHWEGLAEPLQAIHPEVRLPWRELDWRRHTAGDQERLLENFLGEDRERGFDLATPPLMRLTVIRLGENRFQFVWSHHHLLMDGWSMPVVLKAVFEAYQALARGDQPVLEPAKPFRDYIAWLGRADLRHSKSYWRERLADFHDPIHLETGSIPEAEKQAGMDAVHLNCGETLAEQWRLTARRLGITMGTWLQGAWALLLSYYSGQDDVVFGITVSGRPPALADVARRVGLFINTLPARVKTRQGERLNQWLRRLQEAHAGRETHAHCSLVDIQSWCGRSRDQTLFDNILVIENYPMDATLAQFEADFSVEAWRNLERSHYPLAMVAMPQKGLRLRLDFDAGRFERGGAQRILEHYRNLLDHMAAKPRARLGELGLLSKSERDTLLDAWNHTGTVFPNQTIVQLFAARVHKAPQATALQSGDRILTYDCLHAQAAILARLLRARGVGFESKVGILLPRGHRWVTAMLGALLAGGAYLPLDPTFPPERLTYMLADAHARVWLGARDLVLGESGARAIYWEETEKLPRATRPGFAVRHEPMPVSENLAYVIYTSGSTGRPKGVAVNQRAVVRLLFNTHYVRLCAEDRMGQVAHQSFDATTFEVWGALLHGGGLVFVPGDVMLSPPDFAAFLTARAISVMFLTVTLFNQVSLEVPTAFQRMRYLLIGGEALDPTHVAAVLPYRPQFLVNGYGPTEATTFASWHAIEEVPPGASHIPIGRPLANATQYILNRFLQPLPVGVAGELWLGGAGLARGYLNAPALTAARFLPHPFSSKPGERLYGSGDLARMKGDGVTVCLGRSDHQVKWRGFRLELGEIEAALGRHPRVAGAAVVLREDRPGDKRLTAFLTVRKASSEEPSSGESSLTPETLRHFLGQSLPAFMAPSSFVVLKALPLTPSGKLDRKALTRHELKDSLLSNRDYVPPSTPLERDIAAILSQILNVERVGRNDNFFDLGGHSLLATRAVSQMQSTFAVRIPLARLFENPTVSGLAELVENLRWMAQTDTAPGEEAANPEEEEEGEL